MSSLFLNFKNFIYYYCHEGKCACVSRLTHGSQWTVFRSQSFSSSTSARHVTQVITLLLHLLLQAETSCWPWVFTDIQTQESRSWLKLKESKSTNKAQHAVPVIPTTHI